MIFMLYFFSRKLLKIRVVYQVDEVLVTISLKINCELVLRIDFWIRENPERLSILPSSRLIDLWWLSQMMKKVYPDRTKPKIKCLFQFFLNKSLIFYISIAEIPIRIVKRFWKKKDFSMEVGFNSRASGVRYCLRLRVVSLKTIQF